MRVSQSVELRATFADGGAGINEKSVSLCKYLQTHYCYCCNWMNSQQEWWQNQFRATQYLNYTPHTRQSVMIVVRDTTHNSARGEEQSAKHLYLVAKY